MSAHDTDELDELEQEDTDDELAANAMHVLGENGEDEDLDDEDEDEDSDSEDKKSESTIDDDAAVEEMPVDGLAALEAMEKQLDEPPIEFGDEE